ncbi:hypothetical protein IV203_016568 [Nitzschia inconspicua]|uniref:Uncharacterized protein n=1 Tax=Nitzschia inconspicua TaxID=303405 RepID=A0A9K3PHT2_9STRA|nr:hypothetical protein IV203_016568 [Nitzschia inconspicua]
MRGGLQAYAESEFSADSSESTHPLGLHPHRTTNDATRNQPSPNEDEELVDGTRPEDSILDVEDDLLEKKFSGPSQVFQTVEELIVVIDDYQEMSRNSLAIRGSRGSSKAFACISHANCTFRVAFGPKPWQEGIILKRGNCNLRHSGAVVAAAKDEHFRRECSYKLFTFTSNRVKVSSLRSAMFSAREKSPADTARAEIPRRLQIPYGCRRESLDGLCMAGRREIASQYEGRDGVVQTIVGLATKRWEKCVGCIVYASGNEGETYSVYQKLGGGLGGGATFES